MCRGPAAHSTGPLLPSPTIHFEVYSAFLKAGWRPGGPRLSVRFGRKLFLSLSLSLLSPSVPLPQPTFRVTLAIPCFPCPSRTFYQAPICFLSHFYLSLEACPLNWRYNPHFTVGKTEAQRKSLAKATELTRAKPGLELPLPDSRAVPPCYSHIHPGTVSFFIFF